MEPNVSDISHQGALIKLPSISLRNAVLIMNMYPVDGIDDDLKSALKKFQQCGVKQTFNGVGSQINRTVEMSAVLRKQYSHICENAPHSSDGEWKENSWIAKYPTPEAYMMALDEWVEKNKSIYGERLLIPEPVSPFLGK